MPLSSTPRPDFSNAGGFDPRQVQSTGGGFDPNASTSVALSRALPSDTISADFRGGYAGEATFEGGGGFDPNAQTISASLAGKDIKNPSFINPLANLVAINSTAVSETFLSAQGKIPPPGNALDKIDLNKKIDQLSGAVGSAYNGITGSSPSINDVTSIVSGTSNGNGVLNSLQNITGSASNILADVGGALNRNGVSDIIGGGISRLAAQGSAALGTIDNLLGIFRAPSAPAGGETFAINQETLQLNVSAKNDWRVRINCDWNLFNSPLFEKLKATGGVVWPFTPTVNISTKANYTQIETIHSNYPFQGYKNSVVEDITISGDFTCETETDAAYWIAATVFFRTATKMFFGEGDNAGNPPIICNLTGYGSSVFEKVPVVIKSFSVDLNPDVNYINCNTFETNTWVPVISTISVTVSPIYNRRNLRKFSLQQYASGTLTTPDGVGYI